MLVNQVIRPALFRKETIPVSAHGRGSREDHAA